MRKPTEEAIPVKVMKVEPRDISRVLEYVGNIKAQDEVNVYPKVTGKIIEKIKEDGQQVNKGDIIAYIDRDEVGLKFEKAPVESPISGTVGRVYVDIGSNVDTQTAVALVVNMEKAKIALDIPERYLPGIVVNSESEVAVDAYPQQLFKGYVTKVSPVVDIDTRSAPIEIEIDNPQNMLKPGMFAKVKLVIERHEGATAVLKEAIIGKQSDTYAYVIEDNKAILRKVSLGISEGPYVETTEGIKPGELVVIMGQQRLGDNMPVSVEFSQEGEYR
jgi:RND family efflux transporter MFP subunit